MHKKQHSVYGYSIELASVFLGPVVNDTLCDSTLLTPTSITNTDIPIKMWKYVFVIELSYIVHINWNSYFLIFYYTPSYLDAMSNINYTMTIPLLGVYFKFIFKHVVNYRHQTRYHFILDSVGHVFHSLKLLNSLEHA